MAARWDCDVEDRTPCPMGASRLGSELSQASLGQHRTKVRHKSRTAGRIWPMTVSVSTSQSLKAADSFSARISRSALRLFQSSTFRFGPPESGLLSTHDMARAGGNPPARVRGERQKTAIRLSMMSLAESPQDWVLVQLSIPAGFSLMIRHELRSPIRQSGEVRQSCVSRYG
jgi:hypothetical protein